MKIELIILIILLISYIGVVIYRACQPRNFRVLLNKEGIYTLQMKSIWGPWWLSYLFIHHDGDITASIDEGMICRGSKNYINNIMKNYTNYITKLHNKRTIVKIIPIEYLNEE